jgi:curved DNA-binding protein
MADDSLYQALGIARTATADEIRKAYKKIARENHPDVKPDDAAAAQRFKKATEAYNTLKDPEKREQYDRFGKSFGGGGGQRHPWTGAGGGQQVDLRDLFAQTGFSFDDLFGGGGGAGPFGGGGFERHARPQPRPTKGADHELELDVDFRTAALGGTREVSFRRGGKLERIDVKVPAGVDTGSIVRLSGQGEPGREGGPAGDLRLRIKVARHPWFQREGRNLTVEVPVTPSEAALGAKVDVPTLDEGTIVLTLPPGTSSGSKLRVRGKGIADPKGGTLGDQFVVVKIVVPRELDAETRALYEQLAERSVDPRAGMWS